MKTSIFRFFECYSLSTKIPAILTEGKEKLQLQTTYSQVPNSKGVIEQGVNFLGWNLKLGWGHIKLKWVACILILHTLGEWLAIVEGDEKGAFLMHLKNSYFLVFGRTNSFASTLLRQWLSKFFRGVENWNIGSKWVHVVSYYLKILCSMLI